MRSQLEGLLLPTKTKHIHRIAYPIVGYFKMWHTCNIKFDSGLKLKVDNTVLTTKYTHAVTLCLKSCTDYEPLSTSTLFHILRAVKPLQRKPLGKYLYTFVVLILCMSTSDIN